MDGPIREIYCIFETDFEKRNMQAPVPLSGPEHQLDTASDPAWERRALDGWLALGPPRRALLAAGGAAPTPGATVSSSPRLVLGLSGRNRMELPADAEVATVELRRGQAVYVASEAWNRPLHDRAKTFFTIDFRAEFTRYYWRTHNGRDERASRHSTHHRQAPAGPNLQPIIAALEYQAQSGVGADPAVLAALVEAAVREARHDLDRPVPPRDSGRLLWQQGRAWIEEHLHEDLDRARVARVLGVHPNHLSRVWSRCAGESFTAWLTRERLRRAQRLLRDGHTPIAAVARSCGYADPGYFATVFTRAHGLSPRRWRQAQGI